MGRFYRFMFSNRQGTAMGAKDFDSIESDYAFFMAHATEAENDAVDYARELAGFAGGHGSIRMLDFGCGNGEFTERFLEAMNWEPQVLALTLVEPVERQRAAGARRLARHSERPIAMMERLTPSEARFDLVLSNHSLYYVDDLDATLRQLIESLAPRGTLRLAIAGWDNPLLEFWRAGFALLGQEVPYYAAEDVEGNLSRHGVSFRKTRCHYRLRFPDSEENRLKILRFLFGSYLDQIVPQRLLGLFDRYVRGDYVEVNTHCYHFAVEQVPA